MKPNHAPHSSTSYSREKQLFSAAGLVLLAGLASGGASGRVQAQNSPQVNKSSRSHLALQATAKKKPGIVWQKSLAGALALSKKNGRPVLVDFFTTWCGPCKLMDAYTYTHPKVIKESQKWIMVHLDAEASPANVTLAQNYGVSGFPTVVMLNRAGQVRGRITGYADAKSLLKYMRISQRRIKKS